MGISQLSYFVRFFGGLIAIVSGMIYEGKFNLIANVPKLFRVLILIKPTFTNFSQVWDEIRDLDESEKLELETVLAIELDTDISDPEQRKLLQKAITGALGFLELVTSFKRNAVRE